MGDRQNVKQVIRSLHTIEARTWPKQKQSGRAFAVGTFSRSCRRILRSRTSQSSIRSLMMVPFCDFCFAALELPVSFIHLHIMSTVLRISQERCIGDFDEQNAHF
jgi:hypothetical protein